MDIIDKEEIRLLFSRLALRDRAAFEMLYQQTSGYLYAHILRIVHDRAAAADLLQDGYYKLWHGNLRWPDDAPWAWLCQLMRNLALDYLRQHVRCSEEQLSGEWEQPVDDRAESSPPQLTRCLSELDVNKRSAIVLAWYHGCTHQEIAYHLSTAPGTVKSWIRRGLQELRQCLGS